MNTANYMRHTLSVLVENTAGVLSQVSRLFSRKGYNIESLAVGTTDDPEVSRITIEVMCDDQMANQIMIAGALSGVCEALAYAKAKGLDLNVFLRSVATGAAGSAQLSAELPPVLLDFLFWRQTATESLRTRSFLQGARPAQAHHSEKRAPLGSPQKTHGRS